MSARLDTAGTTAEPVRTASPRPFYWSLRREIWENRFIFIAPVAVAALVLAAYILGTLHLPQLLASNPRMMKSGAPPAGIPFSIAAVSVIFTGVIVGVFYCLGALYNERRDRSILFWKSLPVSDLVSVLSKASVPLVILPAVVFVTTLVLQLIMMAFGVLISLTHGQAIPAFWTGWPLVRMTVVLLYGLATLALWHAPIYAWLLMVSAWARRAPFLWAVLPPLGLCIAEKVAFGTTTLSAILIGRVAGSFDVAFSSLDGSQPFPIQWTQLAPMKFFSTPDVWAGFLVAAAFLAAAIRLRRYRGQL